MNMNLISPFVRGGTKCHINLNKSALLDCLSKYNLLLRSGMKMLKGKTVHKINGLISNIQYFSGTGA